MSNAECGTDEMMNAERGIERRAFTLVELLVVMAIIGMVAGILLTAVARARLAARRTEAREAVHQLVTAWKAYLNDYRVMPPLTFDEVDRQMMEILNGREDVYNKKGLIYVEFSSEEWGRNPPEFHDPWGRPYHVAIDNGAGGNDDAVGYDSVVHPRLAGSQVEDVRGYVAAWSDGPDASIASDDIKSW